MKITCIIIDDEKKSIAILKNKLERMCPNVNVIGEAMDAEEGIVLIEKLKPQLVFLDVAMPEMSGFDMLKKIPNPNFELIFVTAFDNYAIDAIRHCAIGYLVKPVDNKDLVETVNKAEENIQEKNSLEKNKLLIENIGVKTFQEKKVVIPTQDGLEFIKIESIVYCEGKEGYTNIYFENGTELFSSKSVGYFNKLLSNQEFYLTHKSFLINLNHITKYRNEGYVELTNSYKVPISRNRRTDFLNKIRG